MALNPLVLPIRDTDYVKVQRPGSNVEFSEILFSDFKSAIAQGEGVSFDVVLEYGGDLFFNSGTISVYRNSKVNIVDLFLDRIGYSGDVTFTIIDLSGVFISVPGSYDLNIPSGSSKILDPSGNPNTDFNKESETNVGAFVVQSTAPEGSSEFSLRITAGTQTITRTFTVNVSNAPGVDSGSATGTGARSNQIYDILESFSELVYTSPPSAGAGSSYDVVITNISEVAVARVGGDFNLKTITGTITNITGNIYKLEISTGKIEDDLMTLIGGEIYIDSEGADLTAAGTHEIKILNNYDSNESVIAASV